MTVPNSSTQLLLAVLLEPQGKVGTHRHRLIADMLQLRVRGAGAAAENSQAIVMNLRCFRHQSHAEVQGGAMKTFRVDVEHGGASLLACWREVWNLYDIAYDGIDVAANRPVEEGVCVHHSMSWEREPTGVNVGVVSEAQTIVSGAWKMNSEAPESVVLVADVRANEAPLILLQAAWILSYVSLITSAVSAASSSDSSCRIRVAHVVFLVPHDISVHGHVLLSTLGKALFSSAVTSLIPTSATDAGSLVDAITEAAAPTVATAEGREGLSRATAWRLLFPSLDTTAQTAILTHDHLQAMCDALGCVGSRVLVPVKGFQDDEASQAQMTLSDAVTKENMVQNFCPCWGCSGHCHH